MEAWREVRETYSKRALTILGCRPARRAGGAERHHPALLVIDRDGILRANIYPFDLETQLRQFMEPKGGSPTG